jgi:hypothetical protein
MAGSVFGWSLPPGVTDRMIDEAAGEDAAPPRQCGRCHAFLKRTPDQTRPWEDALECDGKAIAYEMAYTPGLVAILGDEFEGKTYVEYHAACGDCGDHEAHREVFAGGEIEYRFCRRCGHVNSESVA